MVDRADYFLTRLADVTITKRSETLLLVKGDYVGHPFRGNQWTDASGASTGAGPSGESPDQAATNIPNPYGGMFGGDFDVENGVFVVDEQGMNDFISRQHSEMSLTDQERQSVQHWTGWDYSEINSVVRDGVKLDSLEPELSAQIQTTVKDLTKIFTEATLDQDVIVFRGINDDEFMFEDTSVGDIITDKGFIATSLNPVVATGAAMGFIEGEGSIDNSLLFRIKIPKGAPAFSAEKLSGETTKVDGWFMKPDKELLAEQGYTHSAEIVLPPNTQFKVVGEIWIEQQRTLELEVIHND